MKTENNLSWVFNLAEGNEFCVIFGLLSIFAEFWGNSEEYFFQEV